MHQAASDSRPGLFEVGDSPVPERRDAPGGRWLRAGSARLWAFSYQQVGYVRSTGVRSGRIFEGAGFEYQPMKKVLGEGRTRATTEVATDERPLGAAAPRP